MDVVSLSEFRRFLREHIEGVKRPGTAYLITQYGVPVAVLVPPGVLVDRDGCQQLQAELVAVLERGKDN